jgi:hypothetical protein
MKSTAWIVVVGLAFGVASVVASSSQGAIAAPYLDEKVDLTPKFKAGQTMTFKQHTVRTDSMTLGNVPKAVKPAEKTADGKPSPQADPGKTDPATPDAPKSDPAKTDPAKNSSSASVSAEMKQPAGNSPSAGAGMSSTTTVDQTATYELRVKEASDKGATLELELKSVVASATLPQGKYTWDSSTPPDDKDAGNPILVALRPVVGAVLTIKLGAEGNITSVDGDSRVNLNVRGPLAPNVQALVGPDGIRLRWGAVLWIKDGRTPATVGQTWTNTDTMPNPAVGKFSYVTNNTLRSVKDGIADIGIAGDVKLGAMDDGKAPAGTVKDQSIKGSCKWDVAAGAVKTYEVEQKQTLDINAGGFAVSRTSEFTVTTTRQ